MENNKLNTGDKILILDTSFTRDISINGLRGVITKIVHKNTGTTYNVKCSEDSICCVPESCLEKI